MLIKFSYTQHTNDHVDKQYIQNILCDYNPNIQIVSTTDKNLCYVYTTDKDYGNISRILHDNIKIEHIEQKKNIFIQILFPPFMFPSIENIIIHNPSLAHIYARDVMKGRWIEAELFIKTNDDVWEQYKEEVMDANSVANCGNGFDVYIKEFHNFISSNSMDKQIVKKPELIAYQNYIEDLFFSIVADSPEYNTNSKNVDMKISVIQRNENILVCVYSETDYVFNVLREDLYGYIMCEELDVPDKWLGGKVKDIQIRQINNLDEDKINFYRNYFNDFHGKLIKEYPTPNGYKFVYEFKDNRFATNIGFAFSGRYVLSENKDCLHKYSREINYYMDGTDVEYNNNIHKIYCAYIDVADSKQ